MFPGANELDTRRTVLQVISYSQISNEVVIMHLRLLEISAEITIQNEGNITGLIFQRIQVSFSYSQLPTVVDLILRKNGEVY